MIDAPIFLIDTFSKLYLLILLLRFWLPLLRANFQNPVAQGVLRYTSPLISPVRRFVPAIGRIDTATVIVAFLLQFVVLLIIMSLQGVGLGLPAFAMSMPLLSFALRALLELVMLSVTLFIVAIFVRVILSWIGRYMGPISDILADLTEPLVRPIRRRLPPMGVVDLSMFIVLILLIALNKFLAGLMVNIV